MNKKASNAWHELKWFYRFSVIIVTVILVYIVIYSSFNFSFKKSSLGSSFSEKIVYSKAFKMQFEDIKNVDVIDFNNFNDENINKYLFYVSPFKKESDNKVEFFNFVSPVASQLTLTVDEDSETIFYPSKQEYNILSKSYFSSEKSNVKRFEKIYLVKVYKDSKLKLGVLKTITFVSVN